MIIIYIKNVNRSYLNIYRDQRGSLKLLKMEWDSVSASIIWLKY